MKESTKTTMALRSFLFVALGILLLPSVNGQEPPVDDKPCIHYAYTTSDEYNFLLQNNSKLFGNNLRIVHNCDYVELYVEGEFYARSNNSVIFDLAIGSQNITIQTNQYSRDYLIEVFPDRLEWEGELLLLDFDNQNTEFIAIDLSNSRENWASIFSILIVFVLTTFVYWKLIESYVNKNFIEEVVK